MYFLNWWKIVSKMSQPYLICFSLIWLASLNVFVIWMNNWGNVDDLLNIKMIMLLPWYISIFKCTLKGIRSDFRINFSQKEYLLQSFWGSFQRIYLWIFLVDITGLFAILLSLYRSSDTILSFFSGFGGYENICMVNYFMIDLFYLP